MNTIILSIQTPTNPKDATYKAWTKAKEVLPEKISKAEDPTKIRVLGENVFLIFLPENLLLLCTLLSYLQDEGLPCQVLNFDKPPVWTYP